jgi:hypothetical protein
VGTAVNLSSLSTAVALALSVASCSKLDPKKIMTSGFSLFGNSALMAMGCELLISSDLPVSPGVNYDVDLISCRNDVDVSNSGPIITEDSNPLVDPENNLVRWREKTIAGVTKKVLTLKGFTIVSNWTKRYKVTVAAAEASVRVVSGNYFLSDQLETFDSKVLGGSEYACSTGGVSGFYTFRCPKGSLPKSRLELVNIGAGPGNISLPVFVPYCELWRIEPNATLGISATSVQSMLPTFTFASGSIGIDQLACISNSQQGASVSYIPALASGGLDCTDILGSTSVPVAAPLSQAVSSFFKTAGAACVSPTPSGTGVVAPPPSGGGIMTVTPTPTPNVGVAGGAGGGGLNNSDPCPETLIVIGNPTTSTAGNPVYKMGLTPTTSVSTASSLWTVTPASSPASAVVTFSGSSVAPERNIEFRANGPFGVSVSYARVNGVQCTKTLENLIPYPDCSIGTAGPASCTLTNAPTAYAVHVEAPYCWQGNVSSCSPTLVAASSTTNSAYFASPLSGRCKRLVNGAYKIYTRTCKGAPSVAQIGIGWGFTSSFVKCRSSDSRFYYVKQNSCETGDITQW